MTLEDKIAQLQENIKLKNIVADNNHKKFIIKENDIKKSEEYIKNANNKVLVETLSPQIEKNERVKRIHKSILLSMLVFFLIAQFLALYIFTNMVLEYAIDESSDVEMAKQLFTFIGVYITSIIVELIAVLNYIVKNVFDTSIAELVKIFKEDISETKK